jgi:hypothetical protein
MPGRAERPSYMGEGLDLLHVWLGGFGQTLFRDSIRVEVTVLYVGFEN